MRHCIKLQRPHGLVSNEAAAEHARADNARADNARADNKRVDNARADDARPDNDRADSQRADKETVTAPSLLDMEHQLKGFAAFMTEHPHYTAEDGMALQRFRDKVAKMSVAKEAPLQT